MGKLIHFLIAVFRCSELSTVLSRGTTVGNSEQTFQKKNLPKTDAEKNLFGWLGANTYAACVEISKRADGDKFRASIREVGEVANMEAKRTNLILAELLTDGLLEFAGSTALGAGQFRFSKVVFGCTELPTVLSRGDTVGNSEQKKPQAFAQGFPCRRTALPLAFPKMGTMT